MSSSEDDDAFNIYTNAGKNMSELRSTKFNFSLENENDLTSSPNFTVSPPKISKLDLTAPSPTLDTLDVSDDEDLPPPTRGRRQPSRRAAAASTVAVSRVAATKRASGRGRGRGRGGRRKSGSPDDDIDSSPMSFANPRNWTVDDSLPDPYTDESFSVPEEDLNELFVVKVCWKSGSIFKFQIRKYQKVESIFKHFATLESVPLSQILLTVNNKTATVDDTPDSLKLTIVSIIEAGIITINTGSDTNTTKPAAVVDKDSVELKVRRKDSKVPTMIRMLKTEKMSVLVAKFSEVSGIPREKLKFSFDGDALDPNETPIDLDLEGGEMIDLVVID